MVDFCNVDDGVSNLEHAERCWTRFKHWQSRTGFQTARSQWKAIQVFSVQGQHYRSGYMGDVVRSCVADLPMFNRLHDKFASRGVKVVGVTVESGWAKDIKPHAAKHSIKYTVLVGNQKTVEQYQMIGFPMTYLIGTDGKIVKKYIGTIPDTEALKEADLNHEIEMLLDRGLPQKD